MYKKNKYFLVISLSILFIFTSSCSNSASFDFTSLGNSFNQQYDFPYYLSNTFAQHIQFAEDESNYYFVDYSAVNVMKLDKETLEARKLTNQLQYQSDGNYYTISSSENIDDNSIVGDVSMIQVYDGHLYVIGDDYKNQTDNPAVLYQLDTDGGEKKILYEFSQKPREAMIHRGYIYNRYISFDNPEHKVMMTLERNKFENGRVGESELLYSAPENYSASFMAAYGNKVYLKMTENDNLEEFLVIYDTVEKKLYEKHFEGKAMGPPSFLSNYDYISTYYSENTESSNWQRTLFTSTLDGKIINELKFDLTDPQYVQQISNHKNNFVYLGGDFDEYDGNLLVMDKNYEVENQINIDAELQAVDDKYLFISNIWDEDYFFKVVDLSTLGDPEPKIVTIIDNGVAK